ncbi:hypothetical protein SAMN05661080_02426 [Modestobacter sp. DSM 44400]|uniref:hypothetical protein n=1 Tax=Modestobacter sp. DSM 44400 TaxID=1550230 RepID=UPI0008961C60|nr:hypothetical protein [Modestobacter sp. DSM 44400]SDY13367.1 hypothetical protein SAMN05661080_02426 [Modestobacter sp. DSM 44400]
MSDHPHAARIREGYEAFASARRGEGSFAVTNTHVFRFAGDRVTEFGETGGDQYAVDAVFG